MIAETKPNEMRCGRCKQVITAHPCGGGMLDISHRCSPGFAAVTITKFKKYPYALTTEEIQAEAAKVFGNELP